VAIRRVTDVVAPVLPAAWQQAVARDEAAVEDVIACWSVFDAGAWAAPVAPGRWSPALLADHLVRAYRLGAAVGTPAGTMQTALPRPLAWLAGRTVLPLLLATGRFPRGGQAPPEVVPQTSAPDAAQGSAALRSAATAARAALVAANAHRPRPMVTHAYFGAMPPLLALRLLTAHTRHHAALLAADLAAARGAVSRAGGGT
jgi:hypothetical protein